jgi:hypothetical protein
MFHEYYKSNPDSIDVPEKVHNREFGIQSWEYNWFCPKRKGMFRKRCITESLAFKVGNTIGFVLRGRVATNLVVTRQQGVDNQEHPSQTSKNVQNVGLVISKQQPGGDMLDI